jgi:hypothetical protein
MLYDQIIEVMIILFIRFVLILPQENLQRIDFSENIGMFFPPLTSVLWIVQPQRWLYNAGRFSAVKTRPME